MFIRYLIVKRGCVIGLCRETDAMHTKGLVVLAGPFCLETAAKLLPDWIEPPTPEEV